MALLKCLVPSGALHESTDRQVLQSHNFRGLYLEEWLLVAPVGLFALTHFGCVHRGAFLRFSGAAPA